MINSINSYHPPLGGWRARLLQNPMGALLDGSLMPGDVDLIGSYHSGPPSSYAHGGCINLFILSSRLRRDPLRSNRYPRSYPPQRQHTHNIPEGILMIGGVPTNILSGINHYLSYMIQRDIGLWPSFYPSSGWGGGTYGGPGTDVQIKEVDIWTAEGSPE
jgi:hypothetical protein